MEEVQFKTPPPQPVVLSFGKGELIVGTATSPAAPDAHLVIIHPAVQPGPVGEITDEVVLAFGSFEQACCVADALCQTPPPSTHVDARAEALARKIWGYFKGDSTGGTTAMQWFENNKSLGGPAHIIELCRKAMNPSPETREVGKQS